MNGVEEKGDAEIKRKHEKKLEVLMWGYFPGVMMQQSSLASPASVRFPEEEVAGDSWKDVCGGGCGFGMAISAFGKVITWGSADDQGQSYLASGKHGTPESYPLPTNDPIVKAAAGWAHCVSVTADREVYTWGWKESIPSGLTSMKRCEDDTSTKQSSTVTEHGSHSPQGLKTTAGLVSFSNVKKTGDESMKRRKLEVQPDFEVSMPADETFSMPPCLVNLEPGVKITSVAAGGRHTLALSDVGLVWGWGYGGDGQLGLGSRMKVVAFPHLIPCIVPSSIEKDSSALIHQESVTEGGKPFKSMGNYVKGIACGGRHSAVVTDAGVLLTFGWGSYGQCGQGNTDDSLRPTCVSSLLGTQIEAVAAGLWHTVCIGADGRVHAFGGNQFGQLGLGTSSEQSQVVPKLLDSPILENKRAKIVSSGARHNAILTDDGEIFSWGWNKYGQLGLGDVTDRSIPSPVVTKNYIPKKIACGWWHTLSLCEPTM
ncbi:RCC1 domain-containing protein RUG3, mitochondrial-like isoform X1 [Primulina huaijiensis]|uniref:RCC1 domain-containing protein RUG3, mitochondrial-like isoform X1 n=1 Tax=Primulina huaijiensis TaxID=1492673 RepID=UPI003CC7925C